jgi:riboflavin biosynthesis pyrimidine reductase
MEPLQTLFEINGLPTYGLPDRLKDLYGGELGFRTPRLYANFVSSLDGVVALESIGAESGSVISGHNEADRFVMGLLRACADAVVVGAGTLRAAARHLWTPDHIYPRAAPAYADLRRHLGRSRQPRLALVTSRGDLDPHAPALEMGALVLTTGAGRARLHGRLPSAASVVTLGDGEALDPGQLLDAIHAEGHEVLLCEGGPHLIASLLAAGFVDELFLTVSPVLAGRGKSGGRMGLVEGAELLPSIPRWARLLSLRRHKSHLFLRHDISRAAEESSAAN